MGTANFQSECGMSGDDTNEPYYKLLGWFESIKLNAVLPDFDDSRAEAKRGRW